MKASDSNRPRGGNEAAGGRAYQGAIRGQIGQGRLGRRAFSLSGVLDDWIDGIAPCQWEAHAGLNPGARERRALWSKPPLYSAEERRRRDATPWTLVQGILAPLQFLVFVASLALVVRYLTTGEGYGLATASILVKTILLYTIMITGSIWEKVVFGKWLFAPAFFWEDVCSMLVLGLQTAYLVCLVFDWGSPRQQMSIAVAAYAVYIVNATQFLMKLRTARLESLDPMGWAREETGQLT